MLRAMPDQSTRILIAHSDPASISGIANELATRSCRVVIATDADGVPALLAGEEAFDAALIDQDLPPAGSRDILRRLRHTHHRTPVLILADRGDVDTAVEFMRLGASDYLHAPFDPQGACDAVTRAISERSIHPDTGADRPGGLDDVVGGGPRMQEVFSLVRSVAPSKSTVLLCGESGTGKSMIARAIHESSQRAGAPFVELSCGSIPETLLESELFGHVKGAFSGAHADKAGRFEAADGGTLFLDEINSASPAMQLKLLRVIQERTYERVGSNDTRSADVRIVLATNQPLEGLVERGTFRQDLYYRINVISIDLPPLRERVSDIPALSEHFLEIQGRELTKSLLGFDSDAMAAIAAYHFPGNVRELENVIERAALLCAGPRVSLADLPPAMREIDPPRDPGGERDPMNASTLAEAMLEPERRFILAALEASEWNRTAAAERLGINRATLYKKMKALRIGPAQLGGQPLEAG